MNWDDLRIFLALAEYRTLTTAARHLQVSHSTVSRRLDLLSSRTGAQLFRKTPEGFVLTVAGEALLPIAERMEAEAAQAERLLMGRDARLSGSLVLSTLDGFVELFAPQIKSFQERYPEVELSVRTENQPTSLGRREADVALRATNSPPEHLVGRRLMSLQWAPFASKQLVESKKSNASYKDYNWILWTKDSGERRSKIWLQKQVGDLSKLRVNAARSMGVMVQHGMGAALLPTVIGELWGLVTIGPEIPEFGTDVWVLTHPDLQYTARVRALLRELGSITDE